MVGILQSLLSSMMFAVLLPWRTFAKVFNASHDAILEAPAKYHKSAFTHS